jgi:branched-chain amino acid transport system substrate-binding protein
VLTAFLIMVMLLPIASPVAKAETTVKLGKIASDSDSVWTNSVAAQLAVDDINAYMVSNGIPYQFTYEVKDAHGDAATHLAMVQEFDSEGVKFIDGGGWSSQATSSLQYCNDNGILLLSPSSTSPSLCIAGDNLFRLCPSDDSVAPALASMIKSYGYNYTVIIWRGDSWGDGIVNYFKPAYESLGGTVVGDSSTRYDAWSSPDFSSILSIAEQQVKDAKKVYHTNSVGVLLLSFSESWEIVSLLKNYPNLYGCKWFGSDGTAFNYALMDNAPEQGYNIRLYSLIANFPQGPLWQSASERYYGITGQEFTAYTAFDYDIYWVYALSIVQAGYTPGGNSLDVKSVLPDVAAGFNGASGWCSLNEYGDRPSQGFNIFCYGTSNYYGVCIWCGNIDGNNAVYWDSAAYRMSGSAYGSITKFQNAYSSSLVKGSYTLFIDSCNCHFTLKYSEKNLSPAVEESPKGSIDEIYAEGWGEVTSQTKTVVTFNCWLSFTENRVRLDGSQETRWYGYPATITVRKGSIIIDLPNIKYQNFDMVGKTSSFVFS